MRVNGEVADARGGRRTLNPLHNDYSKMNTNGKWINAIKKIHVSQETSLFGRLKHFSLIIRLPFELINFNHLFSLVIKGK